MKIKRLFTTTSVKGTENYLNTQKKYEVLRTVLYFAVSAALFVGGWVQTGSRLNLLTVVAVLGCLPASKSAVSAVMFLRFRGCSPEAAAEINKHTEGLAVLYDCVFTSYSKNYPISHLAVRGGTVCGFAEADFDENAFYKHIQDILRLDGRKDVTVKIFRSLSKYAERLEQMKELAEEPAKTTAVIETLKSVML